MSPDVYFPEHGSASYTEHDHASEPAADLDPFFVFDFHAVDGPSDDSWDAGRRWSNYWDVERLCRGPEPVPDWVVTDRAAIDTDLGVLKTGKEADVFLLERGVDGCPDQTVVMAAKRYRTEEHRSFHRSSSYTEGRRTRNSRDARAMAKKTDHGRAVAAGQWAWAEWEALKRFWSAGIPVPYPVQIDGTEILMEFVAVDGEAAPRLAQTRPTRALLASYFDQLRDAMAELARHGIAHGDLSPYNILAAGERLVIIDLPQAVDIVGNPAGMDFLMRDCHNVCTWFLARGLPDDLADEHRLFSDLLAHAF
jgi:RIO kinase 1